MDETMDETPQLGGMLPAAIEKLEALRAEGADALEQVEQSRQRAGRAKEQFDDLREAVVTVAQALDGEVEIPEWYARIEPVEPGEAEPGVSRRSFTADDRRRQLRELAKARAEGFTVQDVEEALEISYGHASTLVRNAEAGNGYQTPIVRRTGQRRRRSDGPGRPMIVWKYVDRVPEPPRSMSQNGSGPDGGSEPVGGTHRRKHSDKEIGRLIDEARAQGAQVTNGGHGIKVRHPDTGRRVSVTESKSASKKTIMGVRSRLRRAGFDV